MDPKPKRRFRGDTKDFVAEQRLIHETRCGNDAWDTVLSYVTDINNSIIAVPVGGGCGYQNKLTAAYYWGFRYIVVYDVAGSEPFDQNYDSLNPAFPFRGMSILQSPRNILQSLVIILSCQLLASFKL